MEGGRGVVSLVFSVKRKAGEELQDSREPKLGPADRSTGQRIFCEYVPLFLHVNKCANNEGVRPETMVFHAGLLALGLGLTISPRRRRVDPHVPRFLVI
jgi:hypothetical protein